jgi:hypothetical protein
MNANQRIELKREVELIGRLSDAFGHRFAELVDRLNRPDAAPPSTATLRLCVEAVNMMLDTQTRLARTIARVCDDPDVSANRDVPRRVRPAA